MAIRYRLAITLAAAALGLSAADELPTQWIDPDTGHRVIRLSREDGTQSLYFNQNAYTADGKNLIVTTTGGGIATINLATREVKPLVAGPVSVLTAGHKTGDVYYTKRAGGDSGGATVYATNVDTGATREVVNLPPGRSVASLNADETLLLGTYVDGATSAGAGGEPAAGHGCAFRAAELRSHRPRRQADDLCGCQGSATAQHADGDARRRAAGPVHGEYQDRRAERYLPRA